jgi:phage terminase large subunit-like protein
MDSKIDYEVLAKPVRYTPSLTGGENFDSGMDKLLPVFDVALGGRAEGQGLYNYQKWLLRHAFELYPEGHPKAGKLRFRQVLILVGRQNGKTEIGAAAGIYGLRRNPGDQILGVASNAKQANVLYRRTMNAINRTFALKKRFRKLTETRGIRSLEGSIYEIRPAKADAMQGEPIELGLMDEVHIVKVDLHQAMLAGLGGRDDAILLMISTAGDETSHLLSILQAAGEKALTRDPAENRFGYFVYEAPEPRIPEDRDTLIEWLKLANPKYAEGHGDIDNLLSDMETMRDEDIVRYHLNRNVNSVNVFIGLEDWLELKRPTGATMPTEGRLVFSLERTREWSHATISATTKTKDGKIHTEIVASIVNPNEDQLLKLCVELKKHRPLAYAMDNNRFKNLAKTLKNKGLIVYAYSGGEIAQACSVFYAKIKTKDIVHAGDPLLTDQLPGCIAQTRGNNFVIGRADGAAEIDSVYATALGVYAAETVKEKKSVIY